MQLKIHPEVQDAINQKKAIVGLESTVLSFGLPQSLNLEAGQKFEAIVRENGAIPATIGVVEGVLTIGLTPDELLAFCRRDDIIKCSRRDLPIAIAQKKWGATTVAGTMAILAKAGLRFFATGGLGGVHRGGENSMDVSADLREFERSAVCVVSSGVKSLLDPARTLEYLETGGITVAGFQCETLPLFYTRSSGYRLPHCLHSVEEAAATALAVFDFDHSGMLLCNPVPETDEIPGPVVESWVQEAEIEAQQLGIIGSQITPFMLKKIFELSKEKTLTTNLALLENNAALAAKIAVVASKG
jgi:pseudouridine-5'-phosphate glycosidase